MRGKVETHVMGELEFQSNWDKISSRNQYHELFRKGKDRISIAAHNEHSNIFNQYSRAAMSVFGRMSGYATSGKDNTVLGRWSWMVIDSSYKRTRFITAYRPVKKGGTTRRGKTTEGVPVCEQQRRYFRKVIGMDDPHPIELFDKHLFALVKKCILNNEEVVLMIDANEGVYKGKFAKAIAKQRVNLKSAYARVHEEKMPSSYIRGSKALMGVYISPGIDCTQYFIGRFNLGVGDHRGPHIVSLTMESVLGTSAKTR